MRSDDYSADVVAACPLLTVEEAGAADAHW